MEGLAVKSRFLLLILVHAVLLNGSSASAESDFYVVAGGGAVGTKITSRPYEIKSPGFYYLTGNLTYNGSDKAITVSADNVTIDLMGFSLRNANAIEPTYGIYMNGRHNVEIRNGTVISFNIYGILEDNLGGSNHRVINIRVINNGKGISLFGNNHLVQGCTVLFNTYDGLFVNSGMISGCVACNN
jgi:hypothetical protein